MVSFNLFGDDYYRMFVPKKVQNRILTTEEELLEDAHYTVSGQCLTYYVRLAVNKEKSEQLNSELCETMLSYLDENKIQRMNTLGINYKILVFYTIDNGHETIIDSGCKVLIPSLREAIILSEKPSENELTYRYKPTLYGTIDISHVRDVRNGLLIRKGETDTFRFQINNIVVFADTVDDNNFNSDSNHYGHKHHHCAPHYGKPMPPKDEFPYGKPDNRHGMLHRSPIDYKCHHGLPPCRPCEQPPHHPYEPYPVGPHFYDHHKNKGHHETDYRFHSTHFECVDKNHKHRYPYKENMNQFNAIIDNTHLGHSAIVNTIKDSSVMLYDSSKYIAFAPVISRGFEPINRIRLRLSVVLHGSCILSEPSLVDDILFANTPEVEFPECSDCPYYPCHPEQPPKDPDPDKDPDDTTGDNTENPPQNPDDNPIKDPNDNNGSEDNSENIDILGENPPQTGEIGGSDINNSGDNTISSDEEVELD